MKMQNILRAQRAGKVKSIHAKAGTNVSADEIILEFEPESITAAISDKTTPSL
jgi:biotin carboxyl carrier protein